MACYEDASLEYQWESTDNRESGRSSGPARSFMDPAGYSGLYTHALWCCKKIHDNNILFKCHCTAMSMFYNFIYMTFFFIDINNRIGRKLSACNTRRPLPHLLINLTPGTHIIAGLYSAHSIVQWSCPVEEILSLVSMARGGYNSCLGQYRLLSWFTILPMWFSDLQTYCHLYSIIL